jgi:CubicO group peptidase (beta-lactamase class C family)
MWIRKVFFREWRVISSRAIDSREGSSMRRIVLCAVLLASNIALAAEEPPQSATADLHAAIDAYLAPLVERDDISGNLLVARGDSVVYEGSFGWAHRELNVPVTAATRFNVASVTKPMTVIALISLAVDGKLTLDDPLSKWIPDFPRGDEITVAHLVRHRAGIPHRLTEPRVTCGAPAEARSTPATRTCPFWSAPDRSTARRGISTP